MIAAPPPPAGHVRIDYPGATLIIQATTKWERGFRAQACEKEPWTVAWLESMTPSDVLWNAGANVGSYALIAGARGVPTVAIEPGYASYAALCHNVLANRLESRITPLCLAICARVGIAPLGYRNTEAGAASHAFGVNDAPKTVGTLPTLAMTLDALRQAFMVPAPTHLLIDVDGAESSVLYGGAETLRASVRSVLIEVQDTQAEAIAKLLTAAGFGESARWDRRNGKPIAGGIWYALWQRGGGET